MLLKTNWKYSLTKADQIWLKACYTSFNTGREIKLRELRASLIDKIPIDYSIKALEKSGLCHGNKITLLGILNIDPETKYYSQVTSLITTIKNHIISNPSTSKIEALELVRGTNLPTPEILKTYKLISSIGKFSSGSGSQGERITYINLDQDEVFNNYLRFSSVDDLLDEFVVQMQLDTSNDTFAKVRLLGELENAAPSIQLENLHFEIENIWYRIAQEYEIDQSLFREKIEFIKTSYLTDVIIRDIAHAYILAKLGFSKPAVILAGGVIETLLRTYLEHNNKKSNATSFNRYIEICESEGLLKTAIGHLSQYVRHFRNYVHLEKEESEHHSISKANAIGAVSSIFTIVNDF
ncbi:MAG: hypothetical protein HQ510_10335 [Candidatus Marinimicrobia bacterium]|nr:hypothetical protein [Candidatus Neomarinimicrobiota bacterium]